MVKVKANDLAYAQQYHSGRVIFPRWAFSEASIKRITMFSSRRLDVEDSRSNLLTLGEHLKSLTRFRAILIAGNQKVVILRIYSKGCTGTILIA